MANRKNRGAALQGRITRKMMTRRALPKVKPDKGEDYLKGFGTRPRKEIADGEPARS